MRKHRPRVPCIKYFCRQISFSQKQVYRPSNTRSGHGNIFELFLSSHDEYERHAPFESDEYALIIETDNPLAMHPNSYSGITCIQDALRTVADIRDSKQENEVYTTYMQRLIYYHSVSGLENDPSVMLQPHYGICSCGVPLAILHKLENPIAQVSLVNYRDPLSFAFDSVWTPGTFETKARSRD